MFTIPQPPSTDLNPVDVVAVADPPQALELILRFMYPSRASPVVDDLTVLSEALVLADKYDIDVARGSSLMGFVSVVSWVLPRSGVSLPHLGFNLGSTLLELVTAMVR